MKNFDERDHLDLLKYSRQLEDLVESQNLIIVSELVAELFNWAFLGVLFLLLISLGFNFYFVLVA